MRVSAGGASATGPRPANEDVYHIDLSLGLLVVADGMGGHRAGAVAARQTVEVLSSFIRDTRHSGDLTWPYPFDPSQSTAVNRLRMAIRVANREVHDAGKGNPLWSGMGSTVVAGLIEADRLVVAHAGDSRAYRRRDGRLEQMTRDDTWLNVMIAAGSGSAAAAHPMRHALTRGVGMRPDLSPTLVEVSLTRHEHWLFTTDGAHGAVDPGVLHRAIDAASADVAAVNVVQAAVAAETTDNATAIVLFVEDD
jgi:serine/threonine protein phosphatase PrpC